MCVVGPEVRLGKDANEAAQARFAKVVEALGSMPGVTYGAPGGRLFGHSALKVHDKIFAMISSSGHFVVKLPKARVDALIEGGAGQRFQASQDRPMKEWLEVSSPSTEEWLQLAREALEFVGT